LRKRSTLVLPIPGYRLTSRCRNCGNNPALHLLRRQFCAPVYKNDKSRRPPTGNADFLFFCDEETAPGPSAPPRTAGATRLAGRDLKISGDPRRGRRAATIQGLIGPRRVPRQGGRVEPVAGLKLWRCRRRTRARKTVKSPCRLRRRRREAD